MRIWRRRTYEQTHLQQCDQHWQPTSKLLKWYIIKHGTIGESDIRWLKVCPCSYRFLDHCIVPFCGILVMQYCMLYLALTSYHPLPVPKVVYLNTAKNERKWLKAMGTCGNKTTVIVPAQKYPQCIFCSCLTLFKVSWCWTIFSIGLFTTSMTTARLITSTMHSLMAYSWILSSCPLCKLYIVGGCANSEVGESYQQLQHL